MDKKHVILVVVCLAFFSLSVYGNTFFNDFAYDDEYVVLKNQWITSPSYIPNIFSENLFGFEGTQSNYYRPLLHLSYMAVYGLFGYAAWAFHATNILLHIAVSLLVFLFCFRFLDRTACSNPFVPSLIAGLFFIATPIHTEAVAPIMSITEVAFTLFYLASLYVYIFIERSKKTVWLSAGFFFLSSLCKEPALTLPLMIFVYDYLFDKKRLNFRESVKVYMPYAFFTFLYFILRFHALGGFAPVKKHSGLGIWEALINTFPLVSKYLFMLLFPINLNALHDFVPYTTLFESKVIFSLVIFLGFLTLIVITRKRNNVICFSLVLMFVPLLPTLYVAAIEYPFAERYLYLPSVGLALIVAVVAARMYRSRQGVIVLSVTAFLVIGLCTLGTIERNQVWKNNFTLWSDTVQKSPGVSLAHGNLAVTLKVRGDLEGAVSHYNRAIQIEPRFFYYSGLGDIYSQKGLLNQAVEFYKQALQLNPSYADTYLNLGSTYGEMGHYELAIETFKKAIELAPGLADAHYNLGLAYNGTGEAKKALDHFTVALRLQPENPKFRRAATKGF